MPFKSTEILPDIEDGAKSLFTNRSPKPYVKPRIEIKYKLKTQPSLSLEFLLPKHAERLLTSAEERFILVLSQVTKA